MYFSDKNRGSNRDKSKVIEEEERTQISKTINDKTNTGPKARK